MEWLKFLKRIVWFFLFCACLVFFGCSSTKERSRLDFRTNTRHPFAPPGVTAMDVPRIEPMELKPKKAVIQNNQSDPFAEWPSPLQQPPGK